MGLSPRTSLGPYEVLDLLGAGGMGEVWQARDTRLGRDVAIKVLPDLVANDPNALARFESEARAVAALSHPNILALHDVGKQGAISYVVTELLEGETLRESLVRGSMPVRKAIDIALQVTEGLAAAHEKGIVHRDVKPENVFLTREGRAKLLDFGLARHDVTHHKPSDTRSPTLAALNGKGVVEGTVSYMSPEQARGETVDFRSDQFSLGVVLYEMLTGKRPFAGASPVETMAAIIRDEPEPATKLNPKLPAPLDWILQRCLSKDLEERYSSTRDLAKELQGLRVHLPEIVSASEVGSFKKLNPGRRALVWVLAGFGALFVLFGLHLGRRILRTGSFSASPIRLSMTFPLEASPLPSGNWNPLALSPDGKTLVYAGNSLFVRSLDREETRPIPGTDGGVSPFFSPDGRWVGYFADGKLKKVPLEGGSPITLLNIGEPGAGGYGAGSWGPDGTIVFMPSYFSGLRRMSASGGDTRLLTTVDAASPESHLFPQILPDGENVLFEIEKVGTKADAQAAVVSLRTGQWRVVAKDAGYPRYLPTGHLVFTRRGSLLAAPFSLKRLEVAGLAVPVLDDLVTNRLNSRAAHIAISPEGTLVYRPRGTIHRTLGWVNRSGLVESLPFPPAPYFDVALSPDGTRWAALALEKDESVGLFIGDFARDTLTRTPVEGFSQSLAWTPDGKRLAMAYSATAQDMAKLCWLLADGSTQPEPLTSETPRQAEAPTSFSPDGGLLLFDALNLADSSGLETGWDIFLLSLRGDRRAFSFLQTRHDEVRARFSPNGKWVAYHSNESGRFEVFVRPLSPSGPKWQISTAGGAEARWSPNGRELFYRSLGKLMLVDVDTAPVFRAGRPRMLFEGPFLRPYAVSSDGTRFLMISSDPAESGPTRVNIVLNWFAEVERRVPGAK